MLILIAHLALAAEPPEGAPVAHALHEGPGVIVGDDNAVVRIIEGSPAWEAGIRPGDEIREVDGERTKFLPPGIVQVRVDGLPGVPVTLGVSRGGAAPESLTVERVALDPWNATWVTGEDDRQTLKAWCVVDAKASDKKDRRKKGEPECSGDDLTLKVSDGRTYVGEVVEGLPDGRGKLTADTWTYTGDFVNGRMDGWGTLNRGDGSTVEGTWDEGVQYGMVEVRGRTGRYVGEALAMEPHGKGATFDADDTRTYRGGWQNGLFHGEGELVLPDGTVHRGQFFQGLAHGPGTTTLPSGEVLSGGYVKGKVQGPGRRSYADGRVYEGELRDNKPHGQGLLMFTDGRTHEGLFVEGKPRGYGIRTWSDGRHVEGLFVDSFRAVGRLYDPEGRLMYEGWTRLGAAEGWGRMLEEDGKVRGPRWWFSNGPAKTGTHPRGAQFAAEEKEAFERVDWSKQGPEAFDGTSAEAADAG